MKQPKRAQCLCPNRHPLLEVAWKGIPDEEGLREIEALVERSIAEGSLHPWCALCGKPRESWTYEIQPLPEGYERAIEAILASADRLQQLTGHSKNADRKTHALGSLN